MTEKIRAEQLHLGSIREGLDYEEKTKKVLHFIFPHIQKGCLGPLAQFEHHGRIAKAVALCVYSGGQDVVIDIEKMAEVDFTAGSGGWQSIFRPEQKLRLLAGNSVSETDYALADMAVEKNDLFRVNFTEVGAKTPLESTPRDLTIQLTILI